MIEGILRVIPIDPAEAMSSYSAIGFILLIITCVFLFKQNTDRKTAIKELEKALDGKEKELRNHTNTEADKLHKRIETDLNDVKGTMGRVENSVIKLTTAQEYITKTMDEIKKNIDHIRDKD
jgi:uncharacterized protein YoxC